jgi:hypothetical protein
MPTTAFGGPPTWFRVAALLPVLWNGFGVAMYLSSVGLFGDPTAGLSDAERAAAESLPAAITSAFAIGTLAGLIGSIGLVLRKAWARSVLFLSLAALVVLEGWIVFLSGHREAFGLTFPIIVTGGAALLAWLANHARKRGWLS